MKNRKQTQGESRKPNPGRSDRKTGGEKRSFGKGGPFKPRTSSGSFKRNSEQSDERGEKRTPAKRVYKTESGFGKEPGKSSRFAGRNERSGSGSKERNYRGGEEKRTPAKRAYKTKSDFGKESGKSPRFAGRNERSGSGSKERNYRDGGEKRAPRSNNTRSRETGWNKENDTKRSYSKERLTRDGEKRTAGYNETDGRKPYKKRESRGTDEREFKPRAPRKSAGSLYKERDERPRKSSEKGNTVERVTVRYAEKKKGKENSSKDGKDFRSRNNEAGTEKKGYKKSYEKRRKFEEQDEVNVTEGMRLNRYISNAGVASRREADELITAGLVSINGTVVTELGSKVKPGDEVKFNGERISGERKAYIIMNKPKDTITTLDDPDKRRIVTDLLLGRDLPRVYPVGRLDRNTTGVLILTNDGELSQRLMHPKFEVQKVYKATLNKNFKGEDIRTLANGVELEDGFIKPDTVMMGDAKDKKEVIVELHSGKNRIVHRMFESLGYSLEKLDRVVYAGLNKKGMKRGEWREMNDREVKELRKMVQL